MPTVKRTISIPEDIFAAAELTGKRLGLSRSELYSRAVSQYIKEQDAGMVTQRLNAVYGAEDSVLDPLLAEAQAASLNDDWADDSGEDRP